MELTDLEICKRIAEIEGFTNFRSSNAGYLAFKLKEGSSYEYARKLFNPLTDDALCFKLLVKHNIDLIAPYLPDGSLVWEAQIFIKGCSDALSEYNESPNKAICLAIIEAHND